MTISPSPRLIGLGAGTLLIVGLQLATATSTQGVPLPEQCGTTTYAGFGDPLPAPLSINGNAAVVSTSDGPVLRVTPAAYNQAGSAFTTSKVNLVNGGSFSTKFSFRFSSQLGGGADGVVFTVQNVSSNVGGLGGGIGYQGVAQSIGVELDNWNNGSIDGNSDNHAGIDLNGDVSSVVRAPLAPINLDDPSVVHRAWVDYDGATDALEVRVADSDTRPVSPLLSYTVDLPAVLGGSGAPADDAFIGFTSGTGAAAANHDILSWEFSNCYRPVGVDSPPFVDAGGPYTGEEGAAVDVAGAASDDRTMPLPSTWSATGPGTCSFGDPSTVTTTVTCDQPGTYTLTLSADDGENPPVSDTATLELAASNHAPEVGALSADATGACAVTASARFTDPDAADTHTAEFSWGDTTSSPGTVVESAVTGTATGTATGTHTYGSAGSYTIGVTVTDQDGSSDAETLTYATANGAGDFLPPINQGGTTRSVFKKGSTIPVKIVVNDCDGKLVTTLSPVVQLDRIDTVPVGAVNETMIVESATNGKTMRWVGDMYHYTLSTKNSQFAGGAALTAGTYRITVTDPSLAHSRSVVFDLR
ncbi:lectin-like domain-containing protein [Nocardioides marmoribigeumensis]|uniref:PKD domain-containing protein n=1 Tax=Nocardioides marmoribigeumensis TaxID=433649 RepID=A0ABU2C0N4_9ACTN|nr:hypothetical protein [Nocardioides marmoribigeumensis]MDR7364211.1 hypothetical protein [Nocardioides marmoribigeumensis]